MPVVENAPSMPFIKGSNVMPVHPASSRRSQPIKFFFLAILLAGSNPGWAQEGSGLEPSVRGTDSAVEDSFESAGERPSALTQFTTAVENREPIDQVTFVPHNTQTITFFSDLRGLQGTTVRHRWVYDGKTMAEVDFGIRGARWRVWSSKDLVAEWIGDWTVEIVTETGEVIAAETFTYSGPDA
jgi:hypothetical protein